MMKVAMKEYSFNNSINRSYPAQSGWKKFFTSPLYSGLIGFSLFFTILVITEIFLNMIGVREFISVGIEMVLLSCIGFGVAFLTRLIFNLVKN